MLAVAGVLSAAEIQKTIVEQKFPVGAACITPNGNVIGAVNMLGTNAPLGTCSGTCTLQVNMTKGIDTGVAATRDLVLGAGLTNNHLITCSITDFNPTVDSVRRTSNRCAGAQILQAICVDQQ
jgi:hypothetical protein